MPSKKIRRYTYLTEDEDKALMTSASQSGMSVSKYLKLVGTHVPPRTVIDYEVSRKLFKELSDLRRLGNLYKMEMSKLEKVYKNEVYQQTLLINHQKISNLADSIEKIAKKVMKN